MFQMYTAYSPGNKHFKKYINELDFRLNSQNHENGDSPVSCAQDLLTINAVYGVACAVCLNFIYCVKRKMTLPKIILLRQIFLMGTVMLQSFMCGLMLGYPTVLIPTLLREDTEIKLDQATFSNIAAVRGIGFVASLILFHIIMQKYGRKKIQIICSVPGFIGWLLCYVSQTSQHLIMMQVLFGVHLGGAISILPMIIGEYSSPTHRGVYFTANIAVIATGISIVHTLGAYVYWRTVAFIAMMPNLMCIILAPFWKESSYWLASVGRFDECVKAFHWIRGQNAEDQIELDDLLQKQKERLVTEGSNSLVMEFKRNIMYLRRKNFWKPVIIIMMLNNLIQFSGRYVIMTYSISIITAMTNDESLAYKLTIVTDIVCLGLGFFAAVFVKIMKRRTLLLSSSLVCIVSLFICSLLLFLQSKNVISGSLMWIAFIFFAIFLSATNIGVLPMTGGIFAEILPLIYKSSAGIICGIYGTIVNSVLNKLTPYIISSLGPEGTFFTFGVCMTLIGIHLYKYLPETKDKTLQEIEKFWEEDRVAEKQVANVEMMLLQNKQIEAYA